VAEPWGLQAQRFASQGRASTLVPQQGACWHKDAPAEGMLVSNVLVLAW